MTYQSPFACMNDCAQGTCRNPTTGCQFECAARKEQEGRSATVFMVTSVPAQPVERQELSDEEIYRVITLNGSGGWQTQTDMLLFARAIIAADREQA
jgi:hypothetical protein